MNFDDLRRACAHIMYLVKGKGWGTQPLLVLRFSTIEEYAKARCDLIKSAAHNGRFLEVSPTRESIDIYGVEFVMECTQMMATPGGPISAVSALKTGRLQIRDSNK